MSADRFNREEAINVIAEFVGEQPANPVTFREWLHTLTNDQLGHFKQNIQEENYAAN